MIRRVAWAAVVAVLLVVPASAGAARVEGHSVDSGGPFAIAPGPGNNAVTVGARDCGYLGRFGLVSESLTIFTGNPPLPCSPGDGVYSTVVGPDGKIYFTIYSGKVGRVNPDGTGYEDATVGLHPLDIAVGDDGNVWFAVNGPPGGLGRIVPSTFPGGVTQHDVPLDVQGPRGVIPHPNGKLYLTGGEADKVWAVTPGDPPTFDEVGPALDGPSYGEVGPGGNVWFTLFEGAGVVRLNPANEQATTFGNVGVTPFDVAFGSDRKAYVTDSGADVITQLDPATDERDPLDLPGTGGFPTMIAEAGDGHLYAAGYGSDKVYEVTPDDIKPPQTKITDAPNRRIHQSRARVGFRSTEPGSTFKCKLDRGRFRGCRSPKRLNGLSRGRHVFQVKATDRAGNTDRTPAKAAFKVVG